MPDTKEIKVITEKFTEIILDDITQQVERIQRVAK